MLSFVHQDRTTARVRRTFWNDGLLDLLSGLGVCWMGCAWLFELVPLGAVAPAILIPCWIALRARITEPRLGFVELSERQQHQNKTFLVMSVGIGSVTFVIAIAVYLLVSGTRLEPGVGIAALPAIIIGIMALMTAAITSLSRFVLYAALFAASGIGVAWIDADPGWSLVAAGLATVCLGGITLSRFVARHPLLPGDSSRDA